MTTRKLVGGVALLALAILVAACGTSGSQPPATESKQAEEATAPAVPTPTQPRAAAPTLIKLATPTPKPAPPTPTPIPPSPSPEEQAATPEVQMPAVTDVMVEIPAGSFTMGNDQGDPEDAPAHQVDLPAFEIDKFEVTNADFSAFVEATGYQTFAEEKGFSSWRDAGREGKLNHPVVIVTWNDAQAYCEWLGKRLPSEAEWEKAARGEDGRSFPWGENWDPTKANVKETGLRGTVAVGSFGAGASPYGVEDMIGNVWEWTADWYQPYPGNSGQDPYYGEKFRVTRGGGWFDEQAQATAFNRNAADPSLTANDDLGFRCAR